MKSDLLLVPHSGFGDSGCCGCLIAAERGDEADIVCDKCGALVRTVASADVAPAMLEMAMAGGFCAAACPHCGGLNFFPGWSSTMAYICQECGEGAVVESPIH